MKTTTPRRHVVLTSPLMGGSDYQRLLEREAEIERESVSEGVAAYREMTSDAVRRGDSHLLPASQRLMARWFTAVRDAFRRERRAVKRGKADEGRGAYGPFILTLSADYLAVASMSEMMRLFFDSPDGVEKNRVIGELGNAIMAEINLRLGKRAGESIARAVKRYRRLSSKRVNRWAKKVLGADAARDHELRIHLGRVAMWIVVNSVNADEEMRAAEMGDVPFGAFTLKKKCIRVDRGVPIFADVIHMHPALYAAIDSVNRHREIMRPRFLPMVVPPVAWQQTDGDDGEKIIEGGYLRNRTPIVSSLSRRQREAINAADMSTVFRGMTAIGTCPWSVNRRVLDVVNEFWRRGGNYEDVPPADNQPKPPPPCDNIESAPFEVRLAYRKTLDAWHKENIANAAERKAFLGRHRVANRLADDVFYMPHQLDFRGRAYPLPVGLHHQGSDICRGMLQFGRSRPLGADGAKWLLIHAANVYGADKLSLNDRVGWSLDNRAKMEKSATHPLDDDWWTLADKPWQFLAACFALTFPDAAATLPVQMDGSCNGLQWYAALGRDEALADAVNLSPRGHGDVPADVYSSVLAAVKARVEADAATGHAAATVVLPVLKRDTVKQTVMTKVYGVTMVGARDQVAARLLEAGIEEAIVRKCRIYLATIILESIGESYASADSIMAWLQHAAWLIAKAGYYTDWTSPIGMPVVQDYSRKSQYKITTGMYRVDLRMTDEKAGPSPSRHKSGIAPNFVHSLDAAHMMNTAIAHSTGGRCFAAVHDSYWTHAGDATDLARTLRREFVSINSRPLLADLRTSWMRKYGVALPELPPTGQFDINLVADSPYFFL